MKRYQKNPLNSNSSDFHYAKTMKHLKCRVILSMKVNINCMKLNNSYQSSLSSLSASLNKTFFVRKKALAEWLWLKLLTSILMNSYPEFSRDSSFLLSDIILPETTNVLWVYNVEGGQLWCEIANAANAGLVFSLSCQKQRFIIYSLQKRLFERGFQVVFIRRSSPVPKEVLPPHLEYLPKYRLSIF